VPSALMNLACLHNRRSQEICEDEHLAANCRVKVEKFTCRTTWRVVDSSFLEAVVIENTGLVVGISFLSVIDRLICGVTLVTVLSLYFRLKTLIPLVATMKRMVT
jgi:hypothetical protein